MVSAEELACCHAHPVTPLDHPVRCAIRGSVEKFLKTPMTGWNRRATRHLSDGRRRPAGWPREARNG